MALFKIFKGNDTAKLSNYTALPPTDGYAYYDTTTKLFYIDANYPGVAGISRQPINAAKSDVATLALAAENDANGKTISSWYGHSLVLNNSSHQLSLNDGVGNTLNSVSLNYLPLSGGVMDGRITMSGKPINQILTGTGVAAKNAGSGNNRYQPAKWTFNSGTATDGDIYTIKIPIAGHDYGIFMSVDNGAHYYPVNRFNTARLTTHYSVNHYIQVVFDANAQTNDMYALNGSTTRSNITGGAFRVINDYDSGNTICQIRTENGRFYAGATGVNPYSLVCLDNANKYSMLLVNSTNAGTGTSKTINTSGKYKLPAVILYYAANNTTAANALVPSTYSTFIAYQAVDTRYSHNHTTTFATNTPLYIECTIDANGYWSPTTKCITQTLTTGNYYIYLGLTYSTEYQLSLAADHPCYYYDGTNLIDYTNHLYAKAGHTHTTSLATDTGTSSITLAHGGKYKLTTGGTSVIFTMPADNNTTYSAGTGLSLSGTTFNHSNSVTAKTAAAQSAKTLTWGGTFTLYEEKYDAQGHITGVANYNMTMPSNPNTDYRVRQTNDTSNTNYRLLLSNSANSTQEDNITHKNDNLIYNPSTMTLNTGNLNLTGALDVVGNAYLHNETQADSLTAGSLLVTGNANFTQIPTAPTPASGSNDTSVATTAFVMNAFTANDAMVFKGVINNNSGLPATHKQGWTYKVGTAGQYAGVNCEIGDTIYCVEDGTSANNAHWAVVQANVDVPLYKDGNTFAGSKVLMSDGTGGKVKEGTIATQTVIKTATLSQGTLPTLGTAIAADDITAWDAGSTPTLGTAFSVPNVTGNTSVTASKVTKSDVTVVTNISQAASTSSVIATVTNGVLTITKAITAVGAVTKSTGTANTVSISDVSASKVTLGTAFSIPNVTGVGSVPSLSYTARTIPNVTGVGTLPSLSTTTQSVVTGIS